MSATARRRRNDHRRRARRRLITLVVVVDLFGAALLFFALTGGSDRPRPAPLAAVTVVAHPQDPLAETVSALPTTPPYISRRRHRRATPASAGAPGVVQAVQAAPSAAAASSFAAVAASEPGQVGLAAASLNGGPIVRFGDLQNGHAWSTMKVPVLTTLLRELEQTRGTLTADERQDATLALEQSDNSAAEALFSVLERSDGGLLGASSAVQDVLRAAGDTQTVVNSAPNQSGFTTWGQSDWSASGEAAFYRALANGCLLSGGDTAYVTGLMSNVEPGQRWGAGAAGFPSVAGLAFKGGWGPENGGGYLVRQTAIVGGSRGFVLSMLAMPSDGSFATGTSMLTSIAVWAHAHLTALPAGGASGCG